ncbi:hypothetical protein [Antiquaquibacter soli]|uniref:Uncharacterized protein n=1 Tax=Antiquaquibacter soli TaxID=3064523 RepID=A0ABT9BP90_9MICO|nr:hypothetical protein [Protaetiibacter sp. WY-16]MDO7882843.1 hypothetical protein [Protaetiibacter sp. WY-16]
MNRPAINDLLGGILSGWYESIAEWMPPGQWGADTCALCRTSLLADCVETSEWPHELIHQLASTLESLSLQVFDSLTVNGSFEEVREYIASRVRDSADDLRDVLAECVEPRVEAWAQGELERGLVRVDLLS